MMDWDRVYSNPQQYANMAWFSNEPCRILMQAIKSIAANSHVLEIGCGFGTNAIAMAQQNLTVTATDASRTVIDYCKQSALELNTHVNFLTTQDQLEDHAYDVVVDRFVFHMDIPGFAEHVSRVIKPTGRWISIINNSHARTNWGTIPSMSRDYVAERMKPYFNILSIDQAHVQINNEKISAWVVTSEPVKQPHRYITEANNNYSHY